MSSLVRSMGMILMAAALGSCGKTSTGPKEDACTSATFCATSSLTFSPASANRGTGATVVWGNNSTVTHNLTFDNPAAAQAAGATGGDIAPGSFRTNLMTVAGTYTFHCAIHPQMTGSITIL
jgi:plastocyanin